ncbi:MAG TPA: hypothetical protein VFF27_11055 [Bacteroidia bacterium]|nr:hypothetical protein [Bacteroidia bacterium]
MKRVVVLSSFIFLFVFSFSMQAQNMTAAQKKTVDNLFKGKQVIYFEAVITSMQEAVALKPVISIDGAKGTTIRAHATKEQFSKFIVKNYKYTVIPTPAGKGGKPATAAKKPAAKKKATTTKK